MNNRIISSAIFVIIVNLLAAGNASAVSWTKETVDSSGGLYTSIALDSSGKARSMRMIFLPHLCISRLPVRDLSACDAQAGTQTGISWVSFTTQND